MVERRQVSRREPIEVEVRGKVFVAEPLPWQAAGDLGNEILRQNMIAVNEAVHAYVQDNVPQLEVALAAKISDWHTVLLMCYPKNKTEDFVGFDIDECAGLVLAAMEVNHLEHLKHLVDPNFQTPMSPGGTGTSEGMMTVVGQRIESMLGSSSSDSAESPPSPSPAESSS